MKHYRGTALQEQQFSKAERVVNAASLWLVAFATVYFGVRLLLWAVK